MFLTPFFVERSDALLGGFMFISSQPTVVTQLNVTTGIPILVRSQWFRTTVAKMLGHCLSEDFHQHHRQKQHDGDAESQSETLAGIRRQSRQFLDQILEH